MRKMLKIFLLGLTATIDSWAVGAAYEAADIRIPWLTRALVSLISAATSLAAVFLGRGLGQFVDIFWIQAAGGFVLILIGAKSLWSVAHHCEEKNYDRDSSKTIEPSEGIVLGAVLAADSFCGGLSLCGMGALAFLFPLLVGTFTFFFLVLSGKRVRCGRVWDYAAGSLLVLIGAAQMLGL